MALRRGSLEVSLVLATLVKLGLAVLAMKPLGWTWALAGVSLLTGFAWVCEQVTGLAWPALSWKLRGADTQGVMLGALLMPWTFLGFSLFQARQGITGGLGERALQDVLAASSAMIVCITLWTMPCGASDSSKQPKPAPAEAPCNADAQHDMAAHQLTPSSPAFPELHPDPEPCDPLPTALPSERDAQRQVSRRSQHLYATSAEPSLRGLPPGPAWTQITSNIDHLRPAAEDQGAHAALPLASADKAITPSQFADLSDSPDAAAQGSAQVGAVSSAMQGSLQNDNVVQHSIAEPSSLPGLDSSSEHSSEHGSAMGRSSSSGSLASGSIGVKGAHRWQHLLLMAAAGTMLVLSICKAPQTIFGAFGLRPEHPGIHREPSTAGAFCSRLQPQWGLPPHPSKSTEPTGLLHLPDGLRWEGGGGIEAACPMGRNYSAVWTSSVLRAAANASLSTGGMHLMLAGLPHSFTVGEAMVVAQGLALATTEAALYLYQSAQSLWRAWQASAQLALEPHDAPLLHPTSLHTDPAAASASFQQKGLTSRAPMDLSSTSASLQKSPTHRAPSQLQTGQVSTQSDTTKPSGERAQPTTGVLSSACRQGLSLAGHQVCGLFERMESVVAVISQSTNPAEGITLLLPLGVLVVGGLAAAWARRGKPLPKLWLARTPLLFFVAGLSLTLVGVVLAAAWWTVQHAVASRTRLAILAWWVMLLAAALPAMDWASRGRKAPTIIIRKGYHILAVGLFLPALFLDPPFLSLALSIALALLILIEAIRVASVPYLGAMIHSFMTSFIDARDSGLLLVSHFSLLLGMAVPIWLTVSQGTGIVGQQPNLRAPAAAYAGIIILGFGDSAASVLGRAYGRHRITDGNRKTVEGTLSGAAATLAGWGLLAMLCVALATGHILMGGPVLAARHWIWGWQDAGRFLAASLASCLLEAATTQLDNIFIPLHHFAMLAA